MSLRRRGLSVVAALLLGAAAATPASAQTPTPDSTRTPALTTCSGVWVVVESSLSCATDHETGLMALDSAGHRVEQSGSMICRIDGSPEQCKVALTAYWSYWQSHRQADGSYGPWEYATTGAGTYEPAAGDAEGWSFGDGQTPPKLLPPKNSYVEKTPDTAPDVTDAPLVVPPAAWPTLITLVVLAASGTTVTLLARRRPR